MRRANVAAINKLIEDRQELAAKLLTPQEIERQKQVLLEVSQVAKEIGSLNADAPYDFKRKVIHLIVERIDVNINERWFDLHSIIQSRFAINHPTPLKATRPATKTDQKVRIVIRYSLDTDSIVEVRLIMPR